MTALELQGLSVSMNGTEILRHLDLRIGSAEVVGLIGPNGSGKSTALRCIYRALRPSAGVVRVGDTDLSRLTVPEAARRVAAHTQDDRPELDFTVRELVALGRAPHQRGNRPLTDAEQQLCHRAMEWVGIGHLADRGVLTLSGGERQRVLLARALTQDPEILVLDEPTNHLDLQHQIALLRLVRDADITVVIVLHDLNLAAAACDRLAMLSAGRLVATGRPAEVLTRERIAQVYGADVEITEHPLNRAPQVLFALEDCRRSEGPPA